MRMSSTPRGHAARSRPAAPVRWCLGVMSTNFPPRIGVSSGRERTVPCSWPRRRRRRGGLEKGFGASKPGGRHARRPQRHGRAQRARADGPPPSGGGKGTPCTYRDGKSPSLGELAPCRGASAQAVGRHHGLSNGPSPAFRGIFRHIWKAYPRAPRWPWGVGACVCMVQQILTVKCPRRPKNSPNLGSFRRKIRNPERHCGP